MDLTRPVMPDMAVPPGCIRPARPGPGATCWEPPCPRRATSPRASWCCPPRRRCRREADGTLVATVAGTVRTDEGQVRVEPLLVVSNDRLAVTGPCTASTPQVSASP